MTVEYVIYKNLACQTSLKAQRRRSLVEKHYKRIGEVSRITGLAPSLLRFWEKEFPQLSPLKKGGQRLYSPQDIELILKIKHLVQEMGYTLEGARKALSKPKGTGSRLSEMIKGLEEIKEELKRIKEELSS